MYLWSKKIHRILVLVIIVVSGIMAFTGIVMKYPEIARIFPVIDELLMRYIHNQASVIFSIVLVCMIITGGYMYLFPLLRKAPSPTVTPTQPPNSN